LKKVLFFLFAPAITFLLASGTCFSEEKTVTQASLRVKAVSPSAETRKEAGTPVQKGGLVVINPAARVNGVAISRAELDKSYNDHVEQQGMTTGMISDPDRFKQVMRMVLDSLVVSELLWQDAQNKNFIAKDEDVQQALSSVKSRFPSEDDFKLRLAQSDYTENEYAEFLRRQLSVKEFVRKDIAQRISVSYDEVHGYYTSNPKQFKAPAQVRARHILVKVKPGADKTAREKAKEKIEGILHEAKGGTDFAELAKKYSEGPSGPKGGDLGFISPGKTVRPFEKAAFALKSGEISGVVQTIYGYHIIKVEEQKEPGTMQEKDVQEQLRQFLFNKKVQNAVHERVNLLRETSKVEILL
jgi:peptidyl-prolyl cis-trans isomerase C